MTTGLLSSAQPLITLLHEKDPEIVEYALKLLNDQMDLFWHELSSSIAFLEDLAESKASYSEYAALCAARVWHHMGSNADALRLALEAPSVLDLTAGSTDSFVTSIVASCIEEYVQHAEATYIARDMKQRLESQDNADDISGFLFNSTSSSIAVDRFPDSELISRVESRQAVDFNFAIEKTVISILQSALKAGDYFGALGLSVSCYRLDLARSIIVESPNPAEMLSFLFQLSRKIVLRSYRKEMLHLLVDLYRTKGKDGLVASPTTTQTETTPKEDGNTTTTGQQQIQSVAVSECSDIVALVECFYELDDAKSVGELLLSLMNSTQEVDYLIALQTAFDLNDMQDIRFLASVTDVVFPEGVPTTRVGLVTDDDVAVAVTVKDGEKGAEKAPTTTTTSDATVTVGDDNDESTPLLSTISDSETSTVSSPTTGATTGTTTGATTTTTTTTTTGTTSKKPIYKDSQENRLYYLGSVLCGKTVSSLSITYLCRKSKTDNRCMEVLKAGTERTNMFLQSVLFTTHGFLSCGTSIDLFLRKNVEWMGKATAWSKYMAVAGLGLIHRANPKVREILSSYLPVFDAGFNTVSEKLNGPREHQEAGALFALGLASSAQPNSRKETPFFRETLQRAKEDKAVIAMHSASLGLGLSAVATRDANIHEDLSSLLSQIDSTAALAGEGAGYAIGLNGLGSNNWAICAEILATIRQSPHEKVRRGAAVGIALIAYGGAESANHLINDMLADADPAIRIGGVWALALAYTATSHAECLGRLLSVAVSDVDDGVIRAACMSVGFVLADQPERVPTVLALLAQSHSLHARYGVCMAIGVACAGLGLEIPAAYNIVNGLLTDKSDLVRQAAYISMGLLLHNTNDPEIVTAARESMMEKKKKRAEEAEKTAKLDRKASEKEKEKSSEKEKSVSIVAGMPSSPTFSLSKSAKTDSEKEKEKTDKAEKAEKAEKKKNIGKVATFRSNLYANIGRRGDQVTKMGILLGAGLLDISGRNGRISIMSPSKASRPRAIAAAGLALFCQMWHWAYITPMLALALTPSYLVGIDKSLSVPSEWSVAVAIPAAAMSYPPSFVELKTDSAKAKHINALSVNKLRNKFVKQGLKREASDLASQLIRSQSAGLRLGAIPSSTSTTSEDAKAKEEEKKKSLKKDEVDELSFQLTVPHNPIRYLRTMKGKIFTGDESVVRYVPIRSVKNPTGSFVVLRDQAPSTTTDCTSVLDQSQVVVVAPDVDTKEPSVPTPFALASLGLNPSLVGVTGTSTDTTSSSSSNNNNNNNNNNNDSMQE